ncbi:DNA repair protein RecO [Lentibacillus saliphilus]|uniref:DNA repair protein RecO n=1 Tax=Lentibacillus saliphilus TaxID=2737028 RepID=UPI001C308B73
MLEKIKGIVLRTQDYGETHKIVTIMSPQVGKFSAIARGANKPRSKMAALTQPFIYVDCLMYINRNGLSTLQQGEIIHSYRGIREDIIKTAYSAYIVELTDKLLDRFQPDPFMFKQLYLTLKRIDEEAESAIPIIMYELKMFAKGGFSPILNHCVLCGRSQFPYAFSVAEGGYLCLQCRQHDQHAVTLPDTLAKWLVVFAETDIERIGSISVKAENIKLLRTILDGYYDQYGGYNLKSKRFLQQLNRLE